MILTKKVIDMKKKAIDHLRMVGLFSLVLIAATFISCDEETEDPTPNTGDAPVASFQFAVSETNFLEVAFTNFSQNATSYAWDFGDDTGTSTDTDPTYAYAEQGTYTVKLTATNDAGESTERENTLNVTDPNAASGILTGSAGKSWQLVGDISTGSYPIEVGPNARDQIWWALGLAEELCVRECLMDDTWTFNTDGTFTFDNNGDFWGEGGVWADELVGCFDATDPANYVGNSGQDLSGWANGTHDYTYDPASATMTIIGGFIGLTKVGTSAEFDKPQASVTYKVVKAIDSEVDTLVLETELVDAGGYWSFTLVSYDNSASQVVTGECAAVESVNVNFQVNMAEYPEAYTTVYVSGSFNGWSGNGFPLSDENGDKVYEGTAEIAVGEHEYKFTLDDWAVQEEFVEGTEGTITKDGFTNRLLSTGTVDQTQGPFCWNSPSNCDVVITAADIQSKAWKLESIRVGENEAGAGNWFASDAAWNEGKDCIFDDSFTFGTDGMMVMAIGDQMFGEGSMTGFDADGCYNIADVPENLQAWTGGSFAYTFTGGEAGSNAKIAVTGKGAYIGFFKGATQAELKEPVDGTITYEIISYSEKSMDVSVDFSADQNGSAWWTYTLIAE
jgi:PKD repeat protein